MTFLFSIKAAKQPVVLNNLRSGAYGTDSLGAGLKRPHRASAAKCLLHAFSITFLALVLSSCGGGGDSGAPASSPMPANQAQATDEFLTIDDVQRIVTQGIAEAQSRKQAATIAVVDRMGNV